MTDQRKNLGAYGERLAEQHLIEQGYTIIAKNWRCSAGELDLVAQQGAELVFVEVRTRRGAYLGAPEESITPAKQTRLIRLAYTFLERWAEPDIAWRIDIVAILLDRRGRVSRLNHLISAVGE